MPLTFLETLKEYPDDFRPNKILKFYDIIPISAKESPKDIESVKIKLRKLLDVLYEMQIVDQEQIDENLAISLKEKGPALM